MSLSKTQARTAARKAEVLSHLKAFEAIEWLEERRAEVKVEWRNDAWCVDVDGRVFVTKPSEGYGLAEAVKRAADWWGDRTCQHTHFNCRICKLFLEKAAVTAFAHAVSGKPSMLGLLIATTTREFVDQQNAHHARWRDQYGGLTNDAAWEKFHGSPE